MKGFAQATKDFEIKKRAESIRKGNSPESVKYLENADEISYENTNKDNEDQTNDEFAGRSVLDNVDEIFNLDMPGRDVLGSGKPLYNCEECEEVYKSKYGLYKHTSSRHICKYCGYKATQQSRLKQHEESLHKGQKYSCNQCHYQATQQGNLKRHKKSVHEGAKYFCGQCDYQATQQSSLKTHK